MCGIVYAHDLEGNPVNNLVLNQFDAQRTRGTEGFGLFDGKKRHLVRAAKEEKILKWFTKFDSNMILFHHRYPTSTINVKRAAHPFTTKNYFGDTQYVLVHNGSVKNAKELRREHEEMGIEYYSVLQDGTFNDSEALLWDIALTLEGKQKEMKAYGGIAFICMKLTNDEVDKLYFARNYNPLNMLRTKESIVLSSEGEGDAITPHTLYTYNYSLNRLTKKEFDIASYAENYSSGYSSKYGGYNAYGAPYLSTYNDNYDDDWDSYNEWWNNRIAGDTARRTVEKNMLQLAGVIEDDGRPDFDDDLSNDDIVLEFTEEEAKNVIYTYDMDGAVNGYYLNVDDYFFDIDNEAQNLVWSYIMKAKGKFDNAYWLIENYYDLLLSRSTRNMSNQNKAEHYKELETLERALDFISKDPEYENEGSISSIWRAICDNC